MFMKQQILLLERKINMPKGDKYLGLKSFLEKSGQPMIRLSFEEIEHIIHDQLFPLCL